MDSEDQEILALWKTLLENNVMYILVGGFAVYFNGYSRFTGDLDLWIKDELSNRKNLQKALTQIGLGEIEGIETMQFVPGRSTILLESGFELDLMSSLKGFPSESFEECYRIAPVAIVSGIPVKFLHINDLIEEKKTLGRPKDMQDIIELEKIREGK
ncbi:MAG: hypothetical protein HY064_00240 [Bacteroidetes bacterium]|nr:hypothetical protein [Bacteroidota bacterium]